MAGADSIEHYWQCVLFGSLLVSLVGPLPPLPLDRLGVVAPSRDSMLVPACAYFLFNEIRAKSQR
eukprot:522317-Pyramimonas_sp.AAC.1